MDKYEFNIKVEQIKKLIKNGDYHTAMNIADGIDWRRVSSVNLLSIVSDIYEKNRDYTEAKEILKLAYERAPIGKRLLYKLALLSLKEGNVQEAEAYYRGFYDLAPEDPRQHILRYLILKAKGATADQLINSLEQYNREELDEHWMYELAELYCEAGRTEESAALCDKITLMFGIGNYVERAIDLKLNRLGIPLSDYQQSLLTNRDKYDNTNSDSEEPPDKYDPDADSYQVEKPENRIVTDEIEPEAEVHQKELEDKSEETPEKAAEETEDAETDETEAQTEDTETEVVPAEAALAADDESVNNIAEDEEMTVYTVNFIVERRVDADGLEAAVKLLKLMHEHTGSQNKVAKIKAEKLNETGVAVSREKLAGKDVIVEQAGDLTFNTIEEIIDLIKDEPDKRVVVLIDNPMQVRKLLTAYPELTNLFHVDKEDREAPKQETNKDVVKTAPVAAAAAKAIKSEPVPEERPAAEEMVKTTKEIAMEKKMTEEEMDIDDFANYAQQYAESIDCAISGTSKLALYERIEIMEEDGIPLTRENAVAIIEKAADAAENPSFGHKLSGMFQPKYDKQDRLILREEHFIR